MEQTAAAEDEAELQARVKELNAENKRLRGQQVDTDESVETYEAFLLLEDV